MIKAETIEENDITDHIAIGTIQLEAKGSHGQIVRELDSIISSFNEDKQFHNDLMMVIERVLKIILNRQQKK